MACRFEAGEVAEELGLGRFSRPMSEAVNFLPPGAASGVVCFGGGVAGFDEADAVCGGAYTIGSKQLRTTRVTKRQQA